MCKEIYGAAAVEYVNGSEEVLAKYERLGFGKFPVCIAKTQYSLSADPTLKDLFGFAHELSCLFFSHPKLSAGQRLKMGSWSH